MAGEVDAIERYAYCRDYVSVTHFELEILESDAFIRADVDICENCLKDHR